jgi:DNA-binding beta-propeller fold protein YncE
LSATFNQPTGVTVDGSGNIFVADYSNHLIRRIATGQVTTVAGQILNQTPSPGYPSVLLNEFQDGTGTNATFNFPYQISFAGGSLLVGDSLNQRIRSVTIAEGVVSTLAGTGTIGVLQGGWQDGDATEVARFQAPTTARQATNGDIYIADTLNHRIRRLDTNGNVSTVAGTGDGDYAEGEAISQARFNSPNDIVIAPDGTLYVADTNNHRIRRLVNGQVSTLAGSGNDGLQDGPASTAEFSRPFGLALNPAGTKLYVSEIGNNAIREIDLAANPIAVRTLCGGGAPDFRDGPNPLFDEPHGLAVDANGDLLVADSGNHRIRRIDLP